MKSDAKIFYDQGMLLADRGRFEDAIYFFTNAITPYDHLRTYRERAYCFQRLEYHLDT